MTNVHFNWAGNFTGSGPGTIEFNSILNGNNAAIPARLNFPEGVFHMLSGQLLNAIVNENFFDFATSTSVFSRAEITNNGTFIHSGAGDFHVNADLRFVNNGLYDLRSDADLLVVNNASVGTMVFDNRGVFRKSAGLGTSAFRHEGNSRLFQFDNKGTVEVQSGTLEFVDSVVQFSGNTLTAGEWIVRPFASISAPNATNFTTNLGQVTLDGPGSAFPRINTLTANRGEFTLAGGRDFTTLGNLSNSGQLTAGPGSTLTVNGTLTNNAPAIGNPPLVINIEIADRPSTGQFGQVKSAGVANLTGGLHIDLVGGFGPNVSDQYTILTYPSKSGAFSSITGLAPFFVETVLPAKIVLKAAVPAGDLALQSVAVPVPDVALVGEQIQVTYSARNVGLTDLPGGGYDSVFLSSDRVFSDDDLLLASVQHQGEVLAGATYTESVTVKLPGVIDDDYFVIVIINADKTIPEPNRDNNTGVTNEQIHVSVPPLPFDMSLAGNVGSGESRYFRLDVPAGVPDALLTFQTAAAGAAFELYVDRGRLPTRSQFEFASAQLQSQMASLLITNAVQESYFVLAFARSLSGPAAFTLESRQPVLALSTVVPQQVGTGVVTLHVFGSNLRADDLLELVSPTGTRFAATAVTAQDTSNLFATFDLTGAVVGAYDLVLKRQGTTRTLDDAVTVLPRQETILVPVLQLPARFRTGLVFNGAISYQNTGNVDIPAPMFVLTTDTAAQLRQLRSDPFTSNQLLFIGASQFGVAGILRPGEEWRIPFQTFTATGSDIDFALDFQTADATDAVDWNAVELTLRPPGTPDEEWDPYWEPFIAATGNTVGGYVALMARYATETQARGGNFVSLRDVLHVAMRDLFERANVSIAGQLFLDDPQHPLGQVEILAAATDGSDAAVVHSNSDGSFNIPDLPPGTYDLTVANFLLTTPVQVVIPANGSVPNVAMTVLRGGSIQGSVRQAANEVRLEQITVQLRGPAGLFVVQSDARGQFAFSGLPTGSYELSVGGTPWETELVESVEIDNLTCIRNIVVELVPAASLHGVVKANGQSVAEAFVSLLDSNGVAFATTQTDATGNYAIAGLTAGEYRLLAR